MYGMLIVKLCDSKNEVVECVGKEVMSIDVVGVNACGYKQSN